MLYHKEGELIARSPAVLLILTALVTMSCASNKEAGGDRNIVSRPFGKTPAGESVSCTP